MYCKLDRSIRDISWVESCPQARVEFLKNHHSDHTLSIITLRPRHITRKSHITVKHSWIEVVGPVNPARALIFKLKILKDNLKQFNAQHFSDISQRVKQVAIAYQLASDILKQNLVDPAAVNSLQNTKVNYLEVSRWKEAFYAQRASPDWAALRDDNTTFFHARMRERQARRSINLLINSYREKISSQKQIVEDFVTYYKGRDS